MSENKIIKSGPDTIIQYLGKVIKARALIISFALRDLKVKYSQTMLGIGWTIIQPATALFLFTFFFGYILKWKTGELPFTLYVYSGLLGWTFFTYIVFQGSNSIVESSQIIKKIYFPKLILPLSKILVAFVELCISLVLLVILMIYYEQPVSWRIIFLPVVLLFNILAALSIVAWVGALSYKIRDLLHVVPFMMYFGIWITPVFFTIGILPENLQFLWLINPMTGITEGWRWCLFPGLEFHAAYLISTLLLIPLCISGVWLYVRNESSFSDFV